ncbi:LOW QUALITY PROTEIN: hypothetical protein Cgig2_004234 [Carnegiea gigantea]|uniref:Transmembrane protein n=1 Tax=Carnegiea gigantea TaxID=171969 RepID=A0A9Q1K408_9CARY|nr:LOW QUALITY PROTEIN: hypothetical protein Cgig2_004234 [Carnegiea gigantea]
MNLKKTPPQNCRSVDSESSRTIHATNAPLRRWHVGVRASVCGLGLDFSRCADRWLQKMMEEKGSRKTPSSAARRPPLLRIALGNRTPPSCNSAKAESTGTSHAANTPLRWRRVGVRAFVVMVLLYFLAWFGFGGLEGRKRKKAMSRRLRRRRVLHMCHPSVANLMMFMLQIMLFYNVMDFGTGNRTPPSCSLAKAESIGASNAANAPLRRRCIGVRAFVVMVLLYFSAWIGVGVLRFES